MAEFDMKRFFKKGILDRNDGWRVKKIDPIMLLSPYFMRTRLDSQNLFEEVVSIENLEEFVRQHKDEMPGLSLMHIFIAACVRMLALYPHANRFVVHNKIFARNTITCSIAIKRSLTIDGEETLIKPEFSPFATLQDVVDTLNKEFEQKGSVDDKSALDKTAKLISIVPSFAIRAVVGLIRFMDDYFCLPKFLRDVSPWHSPMFLTNIGSLGISSIYHHLYEFGTSTIFLAMGKKIRTKVFDADGNEKTAKTISLKFVLDERVCDGFYYARAMRSFSKLMSNPELLLTPPEKVCMDAGVSSKVRDKSLLGDNIELA